MIRSAIQVLNNGANSSYTAVSLAAAVPVTAVYITGEAMGDGDNNNFDTQGAHLASTASGLGLRRLVDYNEPTYTDDGWQWWPFHMQIIED